MLNKGSSRQGVGLRWLVGWPGWEAEDHYRRKETKRAESLEWKGNRTYKRIPPPLTPHNIKHFTRLHIPNHTPLDPRPQIPQPELDCISRVDRRRQTVRFGDDLVRAIEEEDDVAGYKIAGCGVIDGCGGHGGQGVEEGAEFEGFVGGRGGLARWGFVGGRGGLARWGLRGQVLVWWVLVAHFRSGEEGNWWFGVDSVVGGEMVMVSA